MKIYIEKLENFLIEKGIEKAKRKLSDDKEFPCRRDEIYKEILFLDFDKIKDSLREKETSASCDALLIFKDFILLMEFKNPYYDKVINHYNKTPINQEELEKIINEKYIPTLIDSVNILKSILVDFDPKKFIKFYFIIEFTEDFLKKIDYMKGLKNLATPEKQIEILNKIKEEISNIINEYIEKIKNRNFCKEVEIIDCYKLRVKLYVYKKDLVYPENEPY